MHLNPQFMWSYFELKPMPYNLRDGSKLILPKPKSSRFGINSLRFRGSRKYSLYLLSVSLTEADLGLLQHPRWSAL